MRQTTSRRSSQPRSAPTASAQEKRALIVESASRLFDEVGYYPTTMDDIAQAVGLAKPTLYHYFSSKDAILLAIHEDFISLLMGRQQERESTDPRDVSSHLYEVMLDILELMRTHRGHVRVFFEHHRELPEEAHEAVNKQRDAYFASVRHLFEVGAESGELHGDPTLSAMALFGMCNWAYQWYDPAGRFTTRDVARYFHGVLLRGIEETPGKAPK